LEDRSVVLIMDCKHGRDFRSKNYRHFHTPWNAIRD
jgi:hypothetical protein